MRVRLYLLSSKRLYDAVVLSCCAFLGVIDYGAYADKRTIDGLVCELDLYFVSKPYLACKLLML
jgi:hypothetical protein